MPPLTRWMVKTALLYLVAALLVGVVQAAASLRGGWGDFPVLRALEPARVHLFVVGWLTLLIFGVVFWMFPKYSRDLPRGHEWQGWAGYVLLNLGLLLRIALEGAAGPGTLAGGLVAASAVLQWLGGLALAALAWSRVKEK